MGHRAAEFEEQGARVLAVAVTATYAQMAFAERLGVDFPMLSDWDRAVCSDYGVRYDAWKGHDGLAKRSVFVLDPDGVVRYRWVTDDAAVQPDLDEVVQVVAALRRSG